MGQQAECRSGSKAEQKLIIATDAMEASSEENLASKVRI